MVTDSSSTPIPIPPDLATLRQIGDTMKRKGIVELEIKVDGPKASIRIVRQPSPDETQNPAPEPPAPAPKPPNPGGTL